MKNIVKCAALGLSIMAASLATAKPAAALPPMNLVNLKAQQEGHAICMGIAGGDPGGHVTAGTKIIVWDCNISNDQAWILNGFAPITQFQDVATDTWGRSMCLNDPGGINDKGVQLNIARCGGPNQSFVLQGTSLEGCFNLVNTNSNRVVGVANAQTNPVKDGMGVIMWDANGSADQIWCLKEAPIIVIG